MYLMYADESGDTGVVNSPTRHFALSSLIVHELRWMAALQQLIDFRRRMREKFGLKMTEEIHAAGMINKPGLLVRIKRNDRLTILRALLDEITHLPDVNAINIIVDKRPTDTSDVVFDRAWRTLIQRFETRSTPTFCRPSTRLPTFSTRCWHRMPSFAEGAHACTSSACGRCCARSRRKKTRTGSCTLK
jgi:hypothetical protein